jgi:hypothetical protein
VEVSDTLLPEEGAREANLLLPNPTSFFHNTGVGTLPRRQVTRCIVGPTH